MIIHLEILRGQRDVAHVLVGIQSAAMVLLYGVGFKVFSWDLAQRNQVNLESGPLSKLTFDVDSATHLVNYTIAYAQTQACASLVYIFVFLQLGEVDE